MEIEGPESWNQKCCLTLTQFEVSAMHRIFGPEAEEQLWVAYFVER